MSSDPSTASQQQQGLFRSAWRWVTKPLLALPTANGRRPRLLAWLLLFILLLTILLLVLVLLVDPPGSMQRAVYPPFILALGVLIALAYGLNRAGYYAMAAGLTVAVGLLGPWGAVILNPAILRGDFVPLGYTIVPVLLSSILLSPLITGAMAGAQLIVLALIAVTDPAAASTDWPSFLSLIFFTSVLCTLSSILSERHLEEIDRQTRELSASEAGLRELSARDHLTQLYNRRYLEEALDREIRRSLRSQHTIGIIRFDVDQFKQVNDRWGHAAGDVVLQGIGRLASTRIRGGDFACRFGGDEFVLVLPGASREVTRKRAEQLRETVRQLDDEYNGQPLGAITVSAGVAVYPNNGTTGDALFKSADKALYRAKSEGSNRVIVASERAGSAG